MDDEEQGIDGGQGDCIAMETEDEGRMGVDLYTSNTTMRRGAVQIKICIPWHMLTS
jgi:hypothetical protein